MSTSASSALGSDKNSEQPITRLEQSKRWGMLIVWIYVLLVAVASISAGFKLAVGGAANAAVLFEFATNPFTALMVGILATALLQSSSTSTSIIVGLVAGGLPIAAAVPMVLGANIGTTVTNTIVSLGQARADDGFKRAFAAATVHDAFNLLAVAIFLPLELYTGVLSHTAGWIASLLSTGVPTSNLAEFNVIKAVTKPPVLFMQDGLAALNLSAAWVGISLALIGVGLIFLAITATGRLLRQALSGRALDMMRSTIGRGSAAGIFSGAAVTVFVQSSSTTTSLMVPLAASGLFKLQDIYPFTLGANIGTTITALLASTAVIGGAGGALALQIALLHFLYNLVAVTLIFSTPVLRTLPIKMALFLAEIGAIHKGIALTYVVIAFFGIPGLLIALTK